ncbi:MAG: Inner membrane protein [Chlamydiales bacterium]|nr:Inner membrane protein [Chlamydiales bacterium]
MDTLLPFIQEHAVHAHWFLFSALVLAGLNFPISEDLVILLAGVLASTLVPENAWKLFLAVFLGAYLSDWMTYWIGRLWGEKLLNLKIFSRLLPPKKLKQVKHFYKKYGVYTLLVGRFIPFGVRNCLFATAGIGRMRFWKFVVADGVACILSNTTLFMLAYFCGKNCSDLLKFVNIGIFSAFILAVSGLLWYRKRASLRAPLD